MPCLRCGGLLLACDFLEEDTPGQASRCLQCGDVVDAVILAHRQHRPEPYSDADGGSVVLLWDRTRPERAPKPLRPAA